MINITDDYKEFLPPTTNEDKKEISDNLEKLEKNNENVNKIESKENINNKKIIKKMISTKQHNIFLLIQIISFIIGLITLFLSSVSLSKLRHDPIIKIFSVVDQTTNIDDYSSLAIANILIIIGTVIMLFLIVFGFFAALWNIGSILEMYILLINIVFMMQSSAIVLASKFHTQISERLDEGLRIHLYDYYLSKPVIKNGELRLDASMISTAWDTAQFHFKCCGAQQSIRNFATNPQSFQNSKWSGNTIDPGIEFRPNFPPSCCKASNGFGYPFEKDSKSLGIKAVSNWRKCLIDGDPEFTYTTSCYEPIKNRIQTHIRFALGSCTFNVAALILCIITALRLLRIIPV